jgi:hypothetical protein
MLRIPVLLGLFLFSTSLIAGNADFKLVRAHHVGERSRTLLIKNGSLLAGRTGTQSEGGSFVEVFDLASHAMTQSVKLPHSIRALQDLDPCSVLVSSTNAYSIVNLCGQTAAVQSFKFGIDFVPHTSSPDGLGGVVFSEPNAGMYRFSGARQVRHLGKHVSYAHAMDLWDGNLWVENYFNIYVIDPSTGKQTKVLKDNEIYGLKFSQHLKTSKGENLVVVSARDDKKLVVVDAETLKVQRVIDTKGEPEGMSTYGDCAVVAISSNKSILFIKLDGENTRIVDSWDADAAGDRLKLPQLVAVDPISKQVFLRSSYPCPTCSVTQSSIFAFTKTDTSKMDQCLN